MSGRGKKWIIVAIPIVCLALSLVLAMAASESDDKDAHAVGIGGFLAVPVPDVAECPKELERVVVQFNGTDAGIHASGCVKGEDGSGIVMRFLLHPNEATPATWASWMEIFGRPWSAKWDGDGLGRYRLATLSLSMPTQEGGVPVEIYKGQHRFRVLSPLWPIAAVLIVGTMIGLLCLAIWTGLLRDANSSAGPDARPFSLGRVQMAWWFAMVFIAYGVLFIATLQIPTLSPTTLVLLGISGTAAVTTAGIDSGAGRAVPATAGFWSDILTDVNGVTLARFQAVVWNALIGILFLYEVMHNLRVPDLDATTLGLLGVSTGTYVGMKIPEKHC